MPEPMPNMPPNMRAFIETMAHSILQEFLRQIPAGAWSNPVVPIDVPRRVRAGPQTGQIVMQRSTLINLLGELNDNLADMNALSAEILERADAEEDRAERKRDRRSRRD